MYKTFVSTHGSARKAPVAQTTPVTPATYDITATVNPTDGGIVLRDPYKAGYEPGTKVTLTATSAKGYTFTGWAGAGSGKKNRITLTMDKDKAVTANFYKKPEPEPKPQPAAPKPDAGVTQEPPAKKRYTQAAVGLDVAGAGMFAYGLYQERKVKYYVNDGKYKDRAEYNNAKNAETNRNIGYVVGSVFLLTGISVHIFF
jgi:uncharacterized repeat protein (TIGR02543 family)